MLTRRTVIKGGVLVAGAAALGLGWPEAQTCRTTLRCRFLSDKVINIPARLSVDRDTFFIKVERKTGERSAITVEMRLAAIREIVAGPPYNGKRPFSALMRDEGGSVERNKLVGWKDWGNFVFQTEGDTPVWMPLADVRKVL